MTFQSQDGPAVSVVVPTYNRGDVLSRAIDSVLDQTFQDFEIVVVDDGSTDDTAQVVTTYDDERVRYVAHDDNQGQNAARNTGIGMAEGRYVSYLDSDDELLPTHLERVVTVLESLPGEFGGVIVGAEDESDGDLRTREVYEGEVVREDLLSGHMYEGIGGLSTLTFKADVIDDVGLHDPTITKCTDWDFYVQLASEYSLYGINETLVRRHLRHDSVSLNAENVVDGERALLAKHGDALDGYNRSLRRHNIAMARAALGDMDGTRRELVRSIREYPYETTYYVNLIFALFGSTIFNRCSRFWTEFY